MCGHCDPLLKAVTPGDDYKEPVNAVLAGYVQIPVTLSILGADG